MKHTLTLLCALFGVWLALSGHYTPFLIGLGALCCVLVVALCLRMGIVDRESVFIHLVRGFLTYAPWLLRAVVRANLDVARRILHPRLPIQPTVIQLPAPQGTELRRVIYANSITLTPGTITLRLADGGLLVHCLTRAAADQLREGEMARRVERLAGDP